MSRIRYHHLAVRELFAAARHRDREQPGGGTRLLQEAGAITARIVNTPGHGTPYLHGTRRFIFSRAPFSSVYVTMEERRAHVVAVAHHRRRPGYWRCRLRQIH
jgi:toxin ParE1/3/4